MSGRLGGRSNVAHKNAPGAQFPVSMGLDQIGVGPLPYFTFGLHGGSHTTGGEVGTFTYSDNGLPPGHDMARLTLVLVYVIGATAPLAPTVSHPNCSGFTALVDQAIATNRRLVVFAPDDGTLDPLAWTTGNYTIVPADGLGYTWHIGTYAVEVVSSVTLEATEAFGTLSVANAQSADVGATAGFTATFAAPVADSAVAMVVTDAQQWTSTDIGFGGSGSTFDWSLFFQGPPFAPPAGSASFVRSGGASSGTGWAEIELVVG